MANEFAQIFSQNCTDKVSPTKSMTVVSSLFIFVQKFSTTWSKNSDTDFKTDLLNSISEDELRGFVSGERFVCKLNNSLCGLKQASRAWNHCLSKYLLELDILRSSVDSS